MPASKLVKPSAEYQESFLEALQEYHQEGKLLWGLKAKTLRSDFAAFIKDMNNDMGHHHRNLQEWAEQVRETIFWLVKDEEFIGYVKIRHRVNWHLERFGGHVSFSIRPSMREKGFGKKILQKALPMLQALNIDRVLLTIDTDNEAAKRIISLCGGRFEDETVETERFPPQMRYWISFK
jgi:predicted acetyltransferase